MVVADGLFPQDAGGDSLHKIKTPTLKSVIQTQIGYWRNRSVARGKVLKRRGIMVIRQIANKMDIVVSLSS